MWESIFKVALTQGIFAALFVALLVWVLKEMKIQRETQIKDHKQQIAQIYEENGKRENRYIETINSLAEAVNKVDSIQGCIERLDEKTEKIWEKVR